MTDGKEIADLLLKFFVSKAMLDTASSSLSEYIDPVVKISQLICQPEDVYDVMVNVGVSKAMGPGGNALL